MKLLQILTRNQNSNKIKYRLYIIKKNVPEFIISEDEVVNIMYVHEWEIMQFFRSCFSFEQNSLLTQDW